MNNQNNFTNQYNLPDQQQQCQWSQINQSQHWQAKQYSNQNNSASQNAFVPPSFSNVNFQIAPPLPPDERSEHGNISQMSGPHSVYHEYHQNANNRGRKNKNWMGNQQQMNVANRGDLYSSFHQSSQQPINQFRDAREMQQNHGGSFQNNNRNVRNVNPNQNWNHKRQTNDSQVSNANYQSDNQAMVVTKSDSLLPTATVTQEEIEFDEQFRKWQEEFDKWKMANANHPDKIAYRQYEEQFESVRVKLLQRRNEMQKKKIELNPPKTVEQIMFETQWKAGSSHADINTQAPAVQPPQPSSSKSISIQPTPFDTNQISETFNDKFLRSRPPPMVDESTFQSNNFDDIQNFGSEGANFDTASHTSGKPKGIPGLSEFTGEKVITESPTKSNEQENFDYEESMVNVNEGPPPMPIFKPFKQRPIEYINNLLEIPGRLKRPEKILILIRGPPGSGKSYLANLIQEKEVKMGSNRCTKLSIHSYSKNRLTPSMINQYEEQMTNELRKTVKENFFKFVIIEIEGGKLLYFNKFAHIASTTADFKCFAIEMYQPLPVCLKYNINLRKKNEIEEIMNDLKTFQSPLKAIYLDPTSLLQPNPSNPPLASGDISGSIDPVNIPGITSSLTQLLQDKNVMNLLQSQLNPQQSQQNQNPPRPLMSQPSSLPRQPQQQQRQQNSYYDEFENSKSNQGANNRNQQQFPDNANQFQPNFNPNYENSFPSIRPVGKENFNYNQNFNRPPPPTEPTFENYPTFTPGKIIDYKHEHMPTFYEQLMEFRVFRVVDYRHESTYQLREFTKDIDIDKIIERRKAVALRKKILEYLRSAERPEDTVSNPKYPKNWEVVEPVANRPRLKNKRKKKLTPKIQRVLQRNADAWMTKGYMRSDKIDSDLEAISSEEDSDNPSVEEVFCFAKPLVEYDNLLLKTSIKSIGSLPSFNAYGHKKLMDIKKLLWDPDRLNRPPRISIILRGAPGSGKSHLAQLIRKKETEMGNSGLRIVSINDYFAAFDEKDNDNEMQLTETFLQQMVRLVDNRMKDSVCNFIIIDAENVDLTYYNKFYQVGTSRSFTTYTIELSQKLEICKAQNIHEKPEAEITSAIEKLEEIRIPSDHTMLIPTALYKNYSCLTNPLLDIEESVDEKMDVESSFSLKSEASEPSELIAGKLFQTLDPKVPKFNAHRRSIINIKDIMEEPGRSQRDAKIMIIMRGPSGSGKTYLAGLIRDKEVKMGNDSGVIILSIDDYFIDPLTLSFKFELWMLNRNTEKMLQNLKSIIEKRSHNFIIVDAENCNMKTYQEFHEVGSNDGFKCYTIELLQSVETCLENNVHNRSVKDIKDALESMENVLIPSDHLLLDPIYLYASDEQSKFLEKNDENRPLKSALKPIENIAGPSHIEIETKPISKNQIQRDFCQRFKQPIIVRGEVIERMTKSPKRAEFNWWNREIVDIREILEEPGRLNRPDRIMIVLRGAPGSGKTYLANLIERKEVEKGNRSLFKLLTIDDSFVTEESREYVDSKGLKQLKKYKKYDYEPTKIEFYMEKLVEQLRVITQNDEHRFIIVDADCCDLKLYQEIFEVAASNNFTGYTIELNQDDDICVKYNDHKRDDEVTIKNKFMRSMPTPDNHILLDPEYLYEEYHYDLKSPDDDEEIMEISDIGSDEDFGSGDENIETSFGPLKKTTIASKWDDDGDASDVVIERLDGTRNKSFESFTSIAAYLTTDDEWTMRPSTSSKKRVRWADIEEKKEQEKMRQIGFIVGQTDWKRMTDTSDGKSALEKTKYIEPRNK